MGLYKGEWTKGYPGTALRRVGDSSNEKEEEGYNRVRGP